VKKFFALVFLLVGALIIPLTTVFALDTNTAINGPESVKNGDTITLSFYLSANEDYFDNGTLDVQYNSADLEFISFTPPPTYDLMISQNGMQIIVNNFNIPKPLNNVLIGTMKFKVLAGPGKTVTVKTANLNFTYRSVPVNVNPAASSWSGTVVNPQPTTPTDPTYTISVTDDGNGTASASLASAKKGKEVNLTAIPNEGYQFKEWQVVNGGILITDNKFNVGTANVTVKAIFELIPIEETSPLEELIVDKFDLYPTFNPDDPNLTDYVLKDLGCTKKININAVPAKNGSKVEIIGAENLTNGTNIIQIIVTDENGAKKEYTIAAMVDCGKVYGKSKSGICNWWWLLLLMFILGSTGGYYANKYAKKKPKKEKK